MPSAVEDISRHNRSGRVVWPSAHAWRACFLQRNEGSNPSLSAGRKIFKAAKAALYHRPQPFGGKVLTEQGSATEIAQFLLGDLTFNAQHLHFTYSSALVKELWDICSTISTSVFTNPASASMLLGSSCASICPIQNRRSASWRNSTMIEKSGS